MQQQRQRQPICVLVVAPHRSGTSATSALLHHWGLWPSTADVDVEGDPHNLRGLWEARRLVELNDRLLGAAGVSWLTAPMLELGWLELLPCCQRWEAEARQLVREAGADGDWCWKDPRLCVTLPFWLNLVRPCVLLVLRAPQVVAESLRRRNGVPTDVGLALWLLSYRHVFAAVPDEVPVARVSFEGLLNDPEAVASRLADWLIGQGVSRLRPRQRAADLFDPALVHRASTQTRPTPIATVARELYECLLPDAGFSAGVPLQAKRLSQQRSLDRLAAYVAESLWRWVQELAPLAQGYQLLAAHPWVRLGRWFKRWLWP